jgi:hypothetical protein
MSDDDPELHARRGDPSTSHAAMAAYPRERMAGAAACVVALYRDYGPMADYELKERFAVAWGMNCSPHLYQQARSVARDNGLVRDSGRKVVNPGTGYKQVVWEYCTTPGPIILRCPCCGKVTGRAVPPPVVKRRRRG